MPDEFYNLTLYEYKCVLARHVMNTAHQWEHTRLISYTLFQINSTKKVSLTDYLPLITDPYIPPAKPKTKEEKEKLLQQAKERLSMLPKKL